MKKINNPVGSIAIGSFDGIHTAHKKLIDQAEGVLVIERGGGYLTPGYKRSRFIDKPIFFYLFEKVKDLSPQEFVGRLKADFPKLSKIIVGYDFRFGQGRGGDAAHLRQIFDGEVVIIDEITINGISVHSAVIREYLQKCNIKIVNKLLGRRYTIDGEIISGQGIGSKELVPTLNLKVIDYQLPCEGVYATRTLIKDKWLPSVSFIGHRISTDGSYAVESHIIGEEIGAAEGQADIEFVDFIRQNRRYASLQELKEQIYLDIRYANSLLESIYGELES